MSGFQPAWYVRRELENGTREVAFFSTPKRVMVTGRLFPNGDLQFVFLRNRDIPLAQRDVVARARARANVERTSSVWDQ